MFNDAVLLLTVHPHVRGENFLNCSNLDSSCGTPPRAWGKPVPANSPLSFLRYTPTCVGKTQSLVSESFAQQGTPPRAWGKLGLTFSLGSLSAVHPHVRGENQLAPVPCNHQSGTPPRAWGKLRVIINARHRGRYTPTCVGKTESNTNTE